MNNVMQQEHGRNWSAYNGDCVEFAQTLPDESIGFSVYSPPFASLYTYSDSVADMGNCDSEEQFYQQYEFLLRELLRATQPGRLTAVHVSDLPKQKWKDGMIGIRDFSGGVIELHERLGWNLHSRITIWKCPVVEMTRTKAHGLLHKTLKKDSCRSRQGMPDYLLVFRKEGDNANPVEHDNESFPVSQWQEWASPVWMTINQTNVLNVAEARSDKDEKHLCPLQLDVIERALFMWSNPGDTVYSPFLGIGSEGFQSVKMGRKFIGTELKPEYFKQAVQNLQGAESSAGDLFSEAAA